VNTGDVFYYDEALQMTNFHSKDLDRTFDVIYFVNQISKNPIGNGPVGGMQGMGGMMGNPHSGKVETGQNSNIQLEKSGEEITISEIFGNRADFSGKEVEIRGVVVKVNKQIMGKNWIHIQDGTNSNGKFDLTITTQQLAEVNDEVTFKGKITLEKDFGSGYFYDVIMEDATLIKKEQANISL
jgi:predicted RNA-binding protein